MTRRYTIGQQVTGEVEKLLPYGVFVCLLDGSRAYIRRRELSLEGDVDPHQILSQGEEIEAIVVAPPTPGRTMELSVRRLQPDPWEHFERQYGESDVVVGTVKSLSPDGVFVQIIPGVDGFVPSREMALWPVEEPGELLWVGDQVEAVITRISRRARRARLSIRHRMKQQCRVLQFAQHLDSLSRTESAEVRQDEGSDFQEVRESANSLTLLGRVLVVDDDKTVLDPLVEWLRRRGCDAEGATSLTQALARLERIGFDLILVDIDLSGEDGVDLIRYVKEANPDCSMTVISVPEQVVERGRELEELGIVEVFAKPLDLTEIEESLPRIVQKEAPRGQYMKTSRQIRGDAVSSFRTLSHKMRTSASLRGRLEAGLQELLALTRAEAAVVFHMDPISRKVNIVAQVGVLSLNHEAVYSLDDSPVKDLIDEGGDIFELHVSRRARRRFSKLLGLLPFQSCIGVPIGTGEEVHHALFLFHREPDAFSHYRLRDAWAIATLFSVALESELLEHRARHIGRFLLSGELAAGFGHEVYNKISGLEIQGRNLRAEYGRLLRAGDIALTGPPTSAKIGRAIDGVLDTTLDLKRVAVSFRELVRSEEREEVDVNQVVQHAEVLLRPTAQKCRVRIATKLAPDLPRTLGSVAQLQQVFSNVMLNAVQQVSEMMGLFSDEWRGVLEVASSWEPEDTVRPIKVRFTDTGPGIHRRLWESIFALGFSTRPGGTGLGLFIARSIVDSMGGRITVERSMIPFGTTFLIELPASETVRPVIAPAGGRNGATTDP